MMLSLNERFLIDTNSVIAPYKTYYSFDFVESFWVKLKQRIESGDVVVMDMVREEIRKGGDELTEWINEVDDGLILSRQNSTILSNYSEVLNYIGENECYKPSALRAWADANVADAWLIAASMTNDYTIVTFEKHNGGLSANQPSKTAKIPNVAEHFSVECCDLFRMMRILNITL